MKSIKDIITRARLKYKNNPKKLLLELENVRTFVSKSNLYIGKKKKVYKLITQLKKTL